MALLFCGLLSCSTQDEQYYLSHPKKLHEALNACPEQKGAMSCAELRKIATRLDTLAYQLQASPQGFGAKILALQEEIAKQEKELKDNKQSPELKASIEQNKQDLAQYLVIVKWLESPEG